MGKFPRDRKQRAGQTNIQMLGVYQGITIIIIFITTLAITVTDRMKMNIQGQTTHTSHTQTHPILKDTNTLYSQTKVMSQILPQFHMGILFMIPQSQQGILFILHKNILFMIMLQIRISKENTRLLTNVEKTMKKMKVKRKCQRSKRKDQN
ncbi:uncharacterized protein LOC134246934 [Saccostrea cucullata]|uniref:uncharacterized protein LOC134246934 n=1 Tax=Saccostrea cuccullata TaxID=36930 RepID=UPI002ED5C62D